MASRRTASTSQSTGALPAKRSASSAGLPTRPPSRSGGIPVNNAQNGVANIAARKPLSTTSPNTVHNARASVFGAKDKLPAMPRQASMKLASLPSTNAAGLPSRPPGLSHSRHVSQTSRTASSQSLENGLEGALANSNGSGDSSQGNIKVVVRCRSVMQHLSAGQGADSVIAAGQTNANWPNHQNYAYLPLALEVTKSQ